MSAKQDSLEPETENVTDDGAVVEPEESAQVESSSETRAGDTEDSGESVEDELRQAQATIQDYWDQIMRLRAELENNRKRAERDIEAAHKYALKSFTENLLPVIDSMEMGQAAAVADNATLDSIREGSELTMNMFLQVLQNQGIEQIDPLGEAFDPDRHQAISMVESGDAKSNHIIEVMQKGFLLNDRLIRPAMVVVAK